MKNKTLVVGWDAADWILIDQFVKEGKMPFLKKLIDGGTRGNLATLNPPLSPILWTSIATSKRANEHGVHGFVELAKADTKVRAVRSTSIKSLSFWNILNQAGLKTNIINWWPSHPAEELNGAVISNHFHKEADSKPLNWQIDKNSFSPDSIFDQIKDLRVHPSDLSLAHILPFIPNAENLDPEQDSVLKSCIKVLAHCASIHNVATELIENSDWDLTAVYLESIDHFCHLAMKFHPPKLDGISDEDFENYHNIIEAAYRYHDMMLERLYELSGPSTNLLLISDHGFESADRRMAILPDLPASPALEHRRFGVFLANGPDFKVNETIYGASILDICPSILHLNGLPIARDMEGKVLFNAFKIKKESGIIPTYENTIDFEKSFKGGELIEDSDAELENLEELGYIDRKANENIQYVKNELKHNLILSLLDAYKFKDALKEIKEESLKDPRIRVIQLDLFLKLGKYELFESNFKEAQSENCDKAQLEFLYANFLLAQGRFKEALKGFKKLEESGIQSPQLYTELAQTCFQLGQLALANEFSEKALKLNENYVAALTLKAQVNLEQNKFDQAQLLINKSLELLFFQPHAHYMMGLIMIENAEFDLATKAFTICLGQAPKHELARKALDKLIAKKKDKKKALVVVSGFPRSGTSFMMQLLQKSGLSIYHDQQRESDQSNPRGYYESAEVLSLPTENSFLKSIDESCIKIVGPLLRYLDPSLHYKIIWMQRPITEVILSQEKMKSQSSSETLKNFPFQRALEMEKEELRLLKWISTQVNMEVLVVPFNDIAERQTEYEHKIADYLGMDAEQIKVSLALDKSLIRNKLGG